MPEEPENCCDKEQPIVNKPESDLLAVSTLITDELIVHHPNYRNNNMKFDLIDQYGRLVIKKRLNSNSNMTKVNVSGAEPGLYFARFTDNKINFIEVKKVIIVR